MTDTTNRNYVKPVFRLVTVMVVMLGLFATRAFESFNCRYFTRPCGNSDSVFGFKSFREFFRPVFSITSSRLFAFLAFSIHPRPCFAFFCSGIRQLVIFVFVCFVILFNTVFAMFGLSVLSNTTLTPGLSTTSYSTISAKLGDGFNLLALRTLFYYDFIRHGFLQTENCVRAVTRPFLVHGSSYYITSFGGVK